MKLVIKKFLKKLYKKALTKYPKYDIIVLASGPVVQLVRTLACHARGRRFDPVPDRHTELSLAGEFKFLLI